MAINVADNFSYQGSKPLDARFQFSTVANMKAYAESSLYDGCWGYVKENKTYYTYDSSNTSDSTTGKWREYSSGGGGTSDYTDLTNKPSIEGVTLSGNKTASDLGLAKTSDIPSISNCYQTGDTAFTDLADADYIPVYDASATTKKKSLWSNIKAILKTYFDTLYSTVTTSKSASSGGTALSLVTTGEKYTWNNKQNALTAGTNIGISGNTISATNTLSLRYSTSEQTIGTWSDGSTLYQKTWTGTLSTAGSNQTIASFSYGGKVKSIESVIFNPNNGYSENGNFYESSSNYCRFYCYNGSLFYKCGDHPRTCQFVITVKYTH